MFQEHFAPKVKSGEKRQTVRLVRKRRPIKLADNLSLRRWKGRPYASKQEVLREEVCKELRSIYIAFDEMMLDGHVCTQDWQHLFAKADGFDSYDDMLYWFNKTHGIPFRGVVIKW